MVLSLHKQPFVTAHFQFITAHFVRHCALKNALEIRYAVRSVSENKYFMNSSLSNHFYMSLCSVL